MTTIEMISALEAFVEDREIEMKLKDSNYWYVCESPNWNFAAFDFRKIQKKGTNENSVDVRTRT